LRIPAAAERPVTDSASSSSGSRAALRADLEDPHRKLRGRPPVSALLEQIGEVLKSHPRARVTLYEELAVADGPMTKQRRSSVEHDHVNLIGANGFRGGTGQIELQIKPTRRVERRIVPDGKSTSDSGPTVPRACEPISVAATTPSRSSASLSRSSAAASSGGTRDFSLMTTIAPYGRRST
jgi:hypothetical protein